MNRHINVLYAEWLNMLLGDGKLLAHWFLLA